MEVEYELTPDDLYAFQFRAERTSAGQKFGPETAVFGTASLSVTFHRPRSDEK